MQNISIIGRIGQDAEVKELGNNQVINFSVAVSESFTKNGQKETKTTWFEIAKWGNSTAVAQYIKKGGQIYISGKPNNRAYAKDDGTIMVVNGINAFEIELLGDKGDSSQTNQQPTQSAGDQFLNSPKETAATNANFKEEDHDDLPFG